MKSYKRILVTGGAGFIGSHLCEYLLKNGHTVLCLDNFYTGSKDNISHLIKNERFILIYHDITEPGFWDVDEIYNLACPASPTQYQRNPIYTIKTNIIGSINMLELAKRNNAKILQASTSEIYGNPQVHPQSENYWGYVNPIGPRSCYDEGKRCAETLFFDYYRQEKVNIRVVRIFNTYGPKMNPFDGRVICNFIVQALKGEDITIYGDGCQTRSFCYIDDLIDGLIRMMNCPDDFVGPVNLGSPHEITIIELARKIVNMTGSSSNLIFKSLPQDDPVKRKPCIDLAVEKLNWCPRVRLDEGLVETIEYFKNILNISKKERG